MTKFKCLNIKILKDARGVSTLPIILLLGGMIMEIAVALALLTYYFNNTNFSIRLSAEALETAKAGIEDAIIKVIRDKNFSGNYPLEIEGRVADITVCRHACVAGKTEILAVASAFNKQKKLKAILDVKEDNGKVLVESVKEM